MKGGGRGAGDSSGLCLASGQREGESLHNVHKAAPAPTSSLSTVSVEKKKKVKVQNVRVKVKN